VTAAAAGGTAAPDTFRVAEARIARAFPHQAALGSADRATRTRDEFTARVGHKADAFSVHTILVFWLRTDPGLVANLCLVIYLLVYRDDVRICVAVPVP